MTPPSLLIVFLFSTPFLSAISAVPEPQIHWAFENNLDHEGDYALRTTPIGTPSYIQGAEGDGLLLQNSETGGQGVLVQDLDLPTDESFTFTAWIKPEELQGGFSDQAPHTIVRFYDNLAPRETSLDFRIRDAKLDVFSAFPSSKNLHSQVDVAVGQWTLVALVCSPNFIRVYAFPEEETFEWGRSCDFNRAIIGVTVLGSNRGLTGLIDEVRIYGGVLSTEELKEVYESQKPD